MAEVPGSEQFFPCDLCLLALGFLGPEASIIYMPLPYFTDSKCRYRRPASNNLVSNKMEGQMLKHPKVATLPTSRGSLLLVIVEGVNPLSFGVFRKVVPVSLLTRFQNDRTDTPNSGL